MAARNRMPPWHENVRLSNGRDVLIRPIRPEDAVLLRAGFALLQPDEVRQRFLHPMKELSADQAERLTRLDRMLIAEHIFWGITTPDLLPWQKKCQLWLVARGIPRPPMPKGIRDKREAFGFPTKEEDIPLL